MNKEIKGSALILVLFIISLMSVIAVITSERLNSSAQNSINFLSKTQSYWYALGLESSAIEYILNKGKLQRFTTTNNNISTPKIDVSINDVNIQGTLKDLNSCFNLNLLVKKEGTVFSKNSEILNIYKNLLLNSDVDEFDINELIFSLIDWLDTNSFTEDANGAEDDYYTRLESPYRTANQLMFNKNELINIKGYSPVVFTKLERFICVIPNEVDTKLNLNSISVTKPELLAAVLDNQITPNEALQVLTDRPVDGFKDYEEFWSHPLLENIQRNNNLKEYLSFSSNFYELQTVVSNSLNSYKMTSILFVNENKSIRVNNRVIGNLEL